MKAGTLYNYSKKWYVDDSLFIVSSGQASIIAAVTGSYHVEMSDGICSGRTDSKLVLDSSSFNFSLELEYDTGFVARETQCG